MDSKNKPPKRLRYIKPTSMYRQFQTLVDAGVRDAFIHHPEYIAQGIQEKVVRESIVKRVTGNFISYVRQTRPQACRKP